MDPRATPTSATRATAATRASRGPLLSTADWATPAPRHRVQLLTRPGCHLCEDARPVVLDACRRTGSEFSERDVSADPELEREYGRDIPVVLVDGVPWDRLRIDAARLQAVLG